MFQRCPCRSGAKVIKSLTVPPSEGYVLAMAAVKFSFANTGLSQDDALDLADMLFKERNLDARSAAQKIREQAEREPDQGETSQDVQLTSSERTALLQLLDALPGEPRTEAIGHLHAELRR